MIRKLADSFVAGYIGMLDFSLFYWLSFVKSHFNQSRFELQMYV